MATHVVAEMRVCTDCRFFVAGFSDEEMGEPYPDAVVAAVAECAARGWHLVNGGEDTDELGFSWSKCDLCDSPLGGDRFVVVALAEH